MAEHPTESTPPPPPMVAQPAPNRRAGKPWQFSVKSLLIVTTVAALLLGLQQLFGFTVSDLYINFLLLPSLGLVPIFFGTCAVHARGHRRTFFAGALAGAVVPLSLIIMMGQRSGSIGWYMIGWFTSAPVVQLISAMAGGGVAIAALRMIERRGWHLPTNDPGDAPPRRR